MSVSVPCRDVLSSKQLSELLQEQRVITVRSRASVDQTLRVLATHRILSAPVLKSDVEGSDCSPRSAVGKITGFIDIRDVLSSFLKELDMETIKDAKMLKRMRILEELGQDFALKSVSSLKSLGSDGSFYNSDEAKSTSVLDIITEGFLNTENKAQDEFGGSRKRHVVHRLALIDGEGQLCHVVSQSDMIKFIFDNLDEFGSVSNETAEALGFVRGQDHVVKVSPDCPAIDAMMLMEERDISAVAVTNAVGAIIGNFSISELRNIMSEHFGSLALPVGEFLALEHGTEYAGYAATKESQNTEASNIPLGTSPGSRPSDAGFKFAHDREMRQRKLSSPGHEVGQRLITCSPETPLSEILSTIVHNRLHRVYVCGEDMVPCGVITLTDLLRKLVSM